MITPQEQRRVIDSVIESVLTSAYDDLLKLNYLDDLKCSEITETVIAAIAKPYVLPSNNKNQLQFKFEGTD